jgi:plasmid stability protein
MASLTIRDLDEHTKQRLRERAARQHRSMEEEARQILRQAIATDTVAGPDLAFAIMGRFRALGGVELVLPPREGIREPGFEP